MVIDDFTAGKYPQLVATYSALESGDSGIISSLLEELATSATPEFRLMVTRSLICHPNCNVRDEVAEILGEIGVESDVRALLMLSKDESWVVRCSAASSLSGWNIPNVHRRLLQMAQSDRAANVRRWSANALLEMDPENPALPELALNRLRVERDIRLRMIWCFVLARIGRKEYKEKMLDIARSSTKLSRLMRITIESDVGEYLAELESDKRGSKI